MISLKNVQVSANSTARKNGGACVSPAMPIAVRGSTKAKRSSKADDSNIKIFMAIGRIRAIGSSAMRSRSISTVTECVVPILFRAVPITARRPSSFPRIRRFRLSIWNRRSRPASMNALTTPAAIRAIFHSFTVSRAISGPTASRKIIKDSEKNGKPLYQETRRLRSKRRIDVSTCVDEDEAPFPNALVPSSKNGGPGFG